MNNKKKVNIKLMLYDFICYIKFLFRPIFTIAFCFVSMLVINGIIIVPMLKIEADSTIYNVLFALVTGVTASFGVSICLELSNNYRFNRRCSLELAEYYSFFLSFEIEKEVKMRKKELFCEEHGSDEEIETIDEIQFIWKSLPKMIPLFQKTVDEKREYLPYKEYRSLERILNSYDQMKDYIKRMYDIAFFETKIREKDTNYLDAWLPSKIKKALSREFICSLNSMEYDEAINKLVDRIFSDVSLMKTALEDEIAVGKNYLENNNETNNQTDYFESWYLSRMCQDILEEIEVLEKEAQKQPVIGYLVKQTKNRNIFNINRERNSH